MTEPDNKIKLTRKQLHDLRYAAIESGLKQYYTGIPCKYGHIDFRVVANGMCIECARAKASAFAKKLKAKDLVLYQKKTRANAKVQNAKNKERYRLERLAWKAFDPVGYSAWVKERNKKQKAAWAKDPEKYAAESKRRRDAYVEKNAERLKQKKKEWVDKNRDKIRLKLRLNYLENKERVDARTKAWRNKNPDKVAARCRNRKARKRNAEGFHTGEDIARILDKQKHKCANCLTRLPKRGYHVDHVRALINGGSNWPDNLQILCSSCNCRKCAKDPFDFAREQGRLL